MTSNIAGNPGAREVGRSNPLLTKDDGLPFKSDDD
jgi:hypothetical protein